ncbi:MAG: ABC transporter permease [Bdellovibrionales bacterium]|nr:ABC transporter permease [Bdellovibrionales bacterium]
MKTLKNLTNFTYDIFFLAYKVFTQFWKKPIYYKIIIRNMYDFGYHSLLTILILGVSTGGVLALQIGKSIERYGAKLYLPKIMSLAIIGEFAPVLTSIILAGRIGAGITSEIGTMKVTEQIDAIRALGVSHIKRVIAPKVLACLLIIPILCLFMGVVAVITGAVIAKSALSLDPVFFITKALYTPPFSFFVFNFSKTFFFALCISLVACHYGLNTTHGAYEVGKATMQAVVTSFLLIVSFDLVLIRLYYMWLHSF